MERRGVADSGTGAELIACIGGDNTWDVTPSRSRQGCLSNLEDSKRVALVANVQFDFPSLPTELGLTIRKLFLLDIRVLTLNEHPCDLGGLYPPWR